MKKIGLIIIILIALLIADGFIADLFMGKEIVSELKGTVFFLKRDKQVLNLYSADANLSNLHLIYSHKGQGEGNENIIGYHYDRPSNKVFFTAMKDGVWSLYFIKPGDRHPHYLSKAESLSSNYAYIKPETSKLKAINKRGSLYLIKDGKEVLLKRYYGIYDSKFAPGYVPLGFSPDSQYLIYAWTGHFTPLGSVLGHLISYEPESLYVMNINTGKTNKYLQGQKIQWIVN